MLNNCLNKLRKLSFDECTLLKDLHTYLFVFFFSKELVIYSRRDIQNATNVVLDGSKLCQYLLINKRLVSNFVGKKAM